MPATDRLFLSVFISQAVCVYIIHHITLHSADLHVHAASEYTCCCLQVYTMPVLDMIECSLVKHRIPNGLPTRLVYRSLYVCFTGFLACTIPFFGTPPSDKVNMLACALGIKYCLTHCFHILTHLTVDQVSAMPNLPVCTSSPSRRPAYPEHHQLAISASAVMSLRADLYTS